MAEDDDGLPEEDEPAAAPHPLDEIPNAADRKSHRRARANQKQREEEARLFWRAVFATAIGRREMWGILQAGHAFEERFACGPNGFPQEAATWCEAGEQRLAFRLYRSWLRFEPEGVQLMMRENDPALATPVRAQSPSRAQSTR